MSSKQLWLVAIDDEDSWGDFEQDLDLLLLDKEDNPWYNIDKEYYFKSALKEHDDYIKDYIDSKN